MSRSSSIEQKALKYKDSTISTHKTIDADHGRIVTRNYTVIHDVDCLQERHEWPGLNAVVMVESLREINGKIASETRFYITSLVILANAVGPMIRAHWAIENSLRWAMDILRFIRAGSPASHAAIWGKSCRICLVDEDFPLPKGGGAGPIRGELAIRSRGRVARVRATRLWRWRGLFDY
jgi:hypothetical protein